MNDGDDDDASCLLLCKCKKRWNGELIKSKNKKCSLKLESAQNMKRNKSFKCDKRKHDKKSSFDIVSSAYSMMLQLAKKKMMIITN